MLELEPELSVGHEFVQHLGNRTRVLNQMSKAVMLYSKRACARYDKLDATTFKNNIHYLLTNVIRREEPEALKLMGVHVHLNMTDKLALRVLVSLRDDVHHLRRTNTGLTGYH